MDQLIVGQAETEVLLEQIQGEENHELETSICVQNHQDSIDEWDNWHPHFF